MPTVAPATNETMASNIGKIPKFTPQARNLPPEKPKHQITNLLMNRFRPVAHLEHRRLTALRRHPRLTTVPNRLAVLFRVKCLDPPECHSHHGTCFSPNEYDRMAPTTQLEIGYFGEREDHRGVSCHRQDADQFPLRSARRFASRRHSAPRSDSGV